MSVYLGYEGDVELQRVETGRGLRSELAPSDVNVARKRFSVNFALGALITGDLITIATNNGSTLELVSGHSYPDWTGYVHIDEVGGIRLYSTFALALAGEFTNSLALVAPSTTEQIKITTRTDKFKCVAQVKSFDMTTSRELVQTTSLSQEFQSQYEAGLISGQGRMSCFWEHQTGTSETLEFSVYLARLVLRLQQGARFRGKFYIYKNEQNNSSVWYECDCIVSSVQVSVAPGEAIVTEVDFVTTGLITLREYSAANSYIVQEDANKILLESNQSGALL
tara:strand:- start:22834 stop:23673 length:840 start_codon:yes stop_codon:yes gene_type:complete